MIDPLSVYPRWRGEHDIARRFDEADNGLSPLARGTQIVEKTGIVFGRFIPAGAGNTVLDHFKFTIDSVYPRWRGEHGMIFQ